MLGAATENRCLLACVINGPSAGGSPNNIACSEDDCGRLSEVCVTGLTPGETYYIQVASFGEDDRGLITVDLTCPCP